MISFIEGVSKFKGPNYLIIMTSGGVGYKVFVPVDVFSQISLDSPTSIFIYTHVKDDALNLYGFKNQEELGMFELLLTVSGIGPKTALSIFSTARLSQIKEAILKGDADFFTSVPRLGRKNAQKIIIELRSKMGNLEDIDLLSESNESKEILDALKSFGFKSHEAIDAIKSIKDLQGSTSDKIRQALKYLGKKV